jgi:hypothetical protein
MSRLPTVGQDNNTWGTVLNEYLSVSLDTDGTIKSTALTSKIGNAVGSPTTITGIWVGTQIQYNALTADSSTLYFIL